MKYERDQIMIRDDSQDSRPEVVLMEDKWWLQPCSLLFAHSAGVRVPCVTM